MAPDNKLLGQFDLVGIPPAPRGIPQIEVTFDIDANGIVHVSAKDLGTGRVQSIKLTASTNLTDAEIERMRKEAEAHADEDKKKKELIEVRNNADNAIYSGEKLIREHGDKIPADVKKQVEDGSAKLRTALNGENVDEIRQLTEELGRTLQKVGGSMYQQGAPEGGGQPGGPGGQEGPSGGQTGPMGGDSGDNVVDGEFRNA